jgi:hypothetical protein
VGPSGDLQGCYNSETGLTGCPNGLIDLFVVRRDIGSTHKRITSFRDVSSDVNRPRREMRQDAL